MHHGLAKQSFFRPSDFHVYTHLYICIYIYITHTDSEIDLYNGWNVKQDPTNIMVLVLDTGPLLRRCRSSAALLALGLCP